MNLWQLFLESIESLSTNKLRSTLTALGIIIGVAAVIAMLGIGKGAEESINSQIESIGTNLLFITPGGDADNPEPLTLDDAAAIANKDQAHSVEHVAPVIQVKGNASIIGESVSTQIYGVTPEYFTVQNISLSEGVLFSESQYDWHTPVAIIGPETAENLFGRSVNVTGEKIRLNGQLFRISGVLIREGGSAIGTSDDRIIIPLTTCQDRISRRETRGEVDVIQVQAISSSSTDSSESVTAATEEVTQILRSRHRSNLGEDDFEVLSTQSFLDVASSVTGTMTAFLGGVAGISLLVGGIGIMNIMLVTVIERTREIGLRKAVGARKKDILVQFLVESSMLSIGGGVLGILMGWGIAVLVGKITAASGMSISPVIRVDAILLATTFSILVGVFFGLYPASRASGLEPVEALRSE